MISQVKVKLDQKYFNVTTTQLGSMLILIITVTNFIQSFHSRTNQKKKEFNFLV